GRSRRRAGRGRAGRAVGPRACAARRGTARNVSPGSASPAWRSTAAGPGQDRVPGAAHEMIVYHAGGLHEGVDDGRPHELEAAARELLRDLSRQLRLRRGLRGGAEAIDLRLAVEKVPEQAREARALLHRLEIGAGREHAALDLQAVAHDAGVLHQRLDLLRREARDLLRREAGEGAAEIVALAQDGDPGQPGLEAVEDELFEQRAVVVFRHAPFLVVIGDVERVLLGPGA